MVKNGIPPLGILQGRLTPSPDGSIQFFPKDNWKNEFSLAKEIGFERIEWLVKKTSSFDNNPIWHSDKLAAINNAAHYYGIKVSSTHGFYSKKPEFPGLFEKIILNSFIFGAKTVLVSFFNDNALKTEADKKFAQRQLSPGLRVAKDLEMRLGIETEMDVSGLMNFVKSFKHPSIGVYYDIGNMASVGVNVAEEIICLGDWIVGVHVKDKKNGKTVPLGTGSADFESAFRALRKVNYAGPIIIQGARAEDVDDVELNRKYYQFCRKLIDKVWGGV